MQGSWKCHVAKTDTNRTTYVHEIMDEAYTHLHVAIRATNLVLNLSTWFGETVDAESSILVGDTIDVTCSYDNPDLVSPIPELKLKLIGGENENEDDLETILARSGKNKIMNQNQLKTSINVTRTDMNKQFVCECVQRYEDADISSTVVSPISLKVFEPPTITDQDLHDLPEYYEVDGSIDDEVFISIPVTFFSTPKPENKNVVWTVINDNMVYESTQDSVFGVAFKLYPEDTKESFETLPIEMVGRGMYRATIELRNITSNLTIALYIANVYGDLVTKLPEIVYYPKLQRLPNNQVKPAGLSLWVTLLIVSILVICIVLFGLVVCITRKRTRRNRGDENEKRGRNLQQVDLDNIPEDKIQYLEHRLLPNDQNTLTFHRSNSDKSKKVDGETQSNNANGHIPHAKNRKNKSTQKPPEKKPINVNNDDIIIEYGANDERDSQLFNEELLNISPNQPDFYAGLHDLEPELVIRQSSVFKDDGNHDINDTVIRTPDGSILRLSGPTNYPVMSPPPPNFTFQRTPSRKTSQIHFMGPTEIVYN